MAIPAQKFREIVFQLLYSRDLAKASEENMVDLLSKELAVAKKAVWEAQTRVDQIISHQEKIDALIAKTSHAYTFERIQTVERCILRIGVFELLFDDQRVPPKVAIAEALRLTRKFSTKEATAFVNAILDVIFQSSLGAPVDSKKLTQSSHELARMEEFVREASLNKTNDQQKNEP